MAPRSTAARNVASGADVADDNRPAAEKVARIRPARKPRAAASLTQKVYERIRNDIFTCVLEPGSEFSEADLAARFKMSKTPVREALTALRSEGYVRTFPRRGYQIVPVTFADVQELFDVRTIVEAGAAELACKRITKAELAQLRVLADVIYTVSEHPTVKRFIKANRDFHSAIARASQNERLHDLVLKQIDALERFFYLGATLRDVNSETKSDHHHIIAALESGDPQKAREVMIQHNDATRRGLIESLSRTDGGSHVRLRL